MTASANPPRLPPITINPSPIMVMPTVAGTIDRSPG